MKSNTELLSTGKLSQFI